MATADPSLMASRGKYFGFRIPCIRIASFSEIPVTGVLWLGWPREHETELRASEAACCLQEGEFFLGTRKPCAWEVDFDGKRGGFPGVDFALHLVFVGAPLLDRSVGCIVVAFHDHPRNILDLTDASNGVKSRCIEVVIDG
ncbi:hypothetical protein ACLOJK_019252 [Asimina triloba]